MSRKDVAMVNERGLPSEKVCDASSCKHEQVTEPKFDSAAASWLKPDEVRKRWPRMIAVCTECKSTVIKYASLEHYIAGDW